MSLLVSSLWSLCFSVSHFSLVVLVSSSWIWSRVLFLVLVSCWSCSCSLCRRAVSHSLSVLVSLLGFILVSLSMLSWVMTLNILVMYFRLVFILLCVL